MGREIAGYVIRLLSGRVVQRTGAYWPIAIGGYALTMAAVPLMARRRSSLTRSSICC